MLAPSVKNPPDNTGDMGSLRGSGSSPGEGHGNLLSILAWKISWTVEPGELQSTGLQRVRQDLATQQNQQRVS